MYCTIGWHVLYVKSHWEKKVSDSLNSISLETFSPEEKIIRQWSDRKKTIFKPLFPSYVFVYIRSSLDFYKALSVKGACAYIRFGKEYGIVTEEEIDQIKLITGNKIITDIKTNVQLPRIGEMKKITYGPLSGLECEILKINNVNKIIVRIDSLQQNIIATIPYYCIEETPKVSQKIYA